MTLLSSTLSSTRLSTTYRPLVSAIVSAGLLTLTGISAAQAASAQDTLDEVRFGVPPWPGITVKSEVASQLLETLGYETRQRELAVSVILNGLSQGDLEAYLAGWYPQERDMLAPLLEDESVVEIVDNIPSAITGIAVTDNAWQAGVRSITDLDDHAERFGNRIYGIEAGSGINDAVLKVIDEERFGLGDWQLQESSASAMLAQVAQKVEKDEWAAFIGWQPHWMNVTYDMHYLEDADNSGAAELEGHVATVVRSDIEDKDANLTRFFEQFVVGSSVQSEWVNAYSREERDADNVAREWITNHQDTVAEWLDGVETRDGEPAMQAVRDQLQ